MKSKLQIIFLFLISVICVHPWLSSVSAQTAARYAITGSGAPAGNCVISGSGYSQIYINRSNGDWYTCSGALGTATGTWVLAGNHSAGTGNVVGPASATNNAIPLYNGTTGKLIKNSAITFDGTTLDASTFKVKAAEYDSDQANIADNGTIRLNKVDFIAWRNAANGGNVILSKDTSDRIASTGGFAGNLTGNVTGIASGNTLVSVVPNTLPSSGQTLCGNVGGTAYAPCSISGSGATFTLGPTGVLTVSAIADGSLSSNVPLKNGANSFSALQTLTGTEGNQLQWTLGGQSWKASEVSGGNWYLNDVTNSKSPFVVSPNAGGSLTIGTTSNTFVGTVIIPTPFTLGAVSVSTTGTELNYVAGVTSAIQTQLNAKQATIAFGAGVQTALGVNIGSAGAPVLLNGAAGTPSSLVGTNITGTASGLTVGAATNATNVGAITKADNVNYFLAFVGANSSSNQAIDVGPATYNPSTSTLTVTNIAGTLSTAAQANITSVGTLIGGATGAGFTVALSTSTITGTLADARLSANVPLLNIVNTFSARQVVSGGSYGVLTNSQGAIYADGGGLRLYGKGAAKSITLMNESGGDAITIDSAGHVFMPSVSTASAASGADACFQGSGGTQEIVTDTALCIVSGRRFKNSIQSDHDGLSFIRRLRPVSYFLNDAPERGRQYGFVAEEVERVNKDFVTYQKDGQIRSVLYIEIISKLTKAVQQQQAEIENLRAAVVRRRRKR